MQFSQLSQDPFPQAHVACPIPGHCFISEVSFIWVSQIWLHTLCCQWRQLVKVIQLSERLSHSPAVEGSMSLEPGVEWTQETNSSSCLVIEDALIGWAGACWRVITRLSFNRLPGPRSALQLCILIVLHQRCDQHLTLGLHHLLHPDSLSSVCVDTYLIPMGYCRSLSI